MLRRFFCGPVIRGRAWSVCVAMVHYRDGVRRWYLAGDGGLSNGDVGASCYCVFSRATCVAFLGGNGAVWWAMSKRDFFLANSPRFL